MIAVRLRQPAQPELNRLALKRAPDTNILGIRSLSHFSITCVKACVFRINTCKSVQIFSSYCYCPRVLSMEQQTMQQRATLSQQPDRSRLKPVEAEYFPSHLA